MNKIILYIYAIITICVGCAFFEQAGENFLAFRYVVAISCVDPEKVDNLNLSMPLANEDRTEVSIQTKNVSTDFYQSVYIATYPSNISPITNKTPIEEIKFTLSYSDNSTKNDVYFLVIPSEADAFDSFPSELFPDGYYYSYLEDEKTFHETLQKLYENNYWGIKKLTPADESITFTYKEACGG